MKVAILTTIREATCLYAIKEKCPGWMPIVAGDLNSPHEANRRICKETGGIYLDPVTQMKLGFTHAAAIPWNCYARKNVAYLFALKEGAQEFYITDDDNVPVQAWDEHVTLGVAVDADVISSDDGWYNCYEGAECGSAGRITPRGFPVWLILEQQKLTRRRDKVKIGVIAGLHLGIPDVDAMTRMVKNPVVSSYPQKDIVLDQGTMCPYDSQNTFITRELMPANMLWSIPAGRSERRGGTRFDDIWAGYVGQVIAWKYGYRVRFGRPFVHQDRNPHDLMQDLWLEIEGMTFQKDFFDTLHAITLTGKTPAQDLRIIVQTMVERFPSLFPRAMVMYVQTWIADLQEMGIE